MNIEIKNKTDNILLSRIRVEATITFENKATPTLGEVKQALSKALEVEKDLIVVKKISTSFGKNQADVLAFQYLSKDEIKNIEPRNKKEEEKAKAEAEKKAKEEAEAKSKAAEAKSKEVEAVKTEAPAEEKKE